MNDEETSRRFDRLEVKIDRLTEVLTNVARVEEKLVGADARLKRHEFRLDDGEKKVEELAELVASNSFVAKAATGVVASIWAGVISVVVFMFKDNS